MTDSKTLKVTANLNVKGQLDCSQTATMLSPSEIESLRQEAKADDLWMLEILAKQKNP
jgi:hypothetical protein